MMNKEELLHKYFLDELTSEEETMFTTLLEDDEEFKTQFEFEKSVQRVIKHNKRVDLKKKIQGFEEESKNVKKGKIINWKPLSIAASIAVIISLGVYMYNTVFNQSTEELFASNYEKYPNTVSPIVRSGTEPQTPEQIAFEAYETDNDTKAIELFMGLKEKPYPEYIDFYLAQSYLKEDQLLNAITQFQKVISANNQFSSPSKWYLALAYLKNKEIQKATATLETIVEKEGYKSKAAKVLLEAMD